MEIKLNKRLSLLSAFIKNNEKIIDIGCDHGLLGIYLYKNRKNISIISSDINRKPLQKAHDNLVKYHLNNKIKLKLGNGLECLDDNTNTIVISGMGGVTIVDILSNIKKYPNIKKIIISPNNDFILTRKKITKLGFKIIKEEIVLENNKYYLITEYQKGRKNINYYFGKLDLTKEEVKKYYLDIYNKNIKILKLMPKHLIKKRIKLIYYNYLIKQKINI